MNIAICDDDLDYLEKMRKLIEKFFLEVKIDCKVSTFSSGKVLCALETKLCQFQMIFLDSEMPEMDGITTAKIIRNIDEDVPIIFVSAFIEYAPKGYSVNAYAYILKSNLELELRECLKRLLKEGRLRERSIELPCSDGIQIINLKNILWIESNRRVLTFNILENGERKQYYLNKKLDVLEKELNYENLIRIHKSYLVNGKIIVRIKNYEAYLNISGKEESFSLPIPKEKYSEVKKKWLEYKEKW